MRRPWIAFCLAMTICGSSLSQDGGVPASASSVPAIEEVVVTGEQPGPQLWRATKDGHVLWILGTVTPKPRDITWRSKQVATVLDDTQQVINQQLQGTTWPANIELDVDTINPIKKISVARKVSALRKALAPPPPLKDVLPADLYERFARVKQRYLPRSTAIEHQRPRVAADMLYGAAVEATGLTSRAMIHEGVHRLARKRRVPVSEVTLEVDADVETLIVINTEFNEIPVSAEIECLEITLNQLEHELPTITARANAWAIGDVNALRRLPALRREACDTVRWSAPRWSDLDSRLEALWFDTIDTAVARNRSTLVMLDMAELLEADGLLASLVMRGYQVEGP